MTDREYLIRRAALMAAFGEPSECPEPNDPSVSERIFLEARALFRDGRQCAGWDTFEMADMCDTADSRDDECAFHRLGGTGPCNYCEGNNQ